MKTRHNVMALLALIGLGGLPLGGFADPSATQVSGIEVDSTGNLVLNVSGEGFDPLVRLETAANGQYRILLQSDEASLSPELVQARQQVVQALQTKIPAIEKTDFTQEQPAGQGFRVVITVWQKLQPQVRSNTGSQIVIGLTGNHNLPPLIAAKKQQAETARKVAEHRQQQAKAQQEAAQHKAEALQQQREQATAAKKRQQEVLLALQSAQKKAQNVSAPASSKPSAKPLVQIPNSQKRQNLVNLQQNSPIGNRPAIAIGNANLDLSDSQLANQPDDAAFPLDSINFQLTQEMQKTLKAFTPEVLAQDKIPSAISPTGFLPPNSIASPNADADNEQDAVPIQPLKLKATPANFTPGEDQGNFDLPADAAPSGFQRVFSIQNTQSLYSLLNNPNANAGIQKAWQNITAGNLTAAELGLRNWLEKTPTDTIARFFLAQVLLQPVTETMPDSTGKTLPETTARREAARQELLKIVGQTPYLPAYLALLENYIDDENYPEAQRLWVKVSSLYPNEAAVFYEQGRLNEGVKDTATARYAYLQALSKQPGNPEYHYRLAQLELQDGHPDTARWELTQALALAPNDGRLWKLMGYIAEKRQEPDKATRFYRQAVQADALINLARALENQGPAQKEQAQTLYKAVESLAGNDLDLLYNLGMIYAGQHKADRAETVLKRFIQLNQNTEDSRIPQAKTTLKELGKKVSSNAHSQPSILPY